MSSKKCCVPGCSGNSHSQTILHLFPNPAKDIDRFRSWVFNIGGDILKLNNEYIYKIRRVCHAHFELKYCCRFNRISKIAVPTLNLPVLGSTFLTFPQPTKAPDMFKTRENLAGETLNGTDDEIYKNKKVCDIQFEQKQRNRSNSLSVIAVPSLQLPGVHDKVDNEVSSQKTIDLATESDDTVDFNVSPQKTIVMDTESSQVLHIELNYVFYWIPIFIGIENLYITVLPSETGCGHQIRPVHDFGLSGARRGERGGVGERCVQNRFSL